MLLIPMLLGVAVGLILGLTGAGGSILAVPLLMWGLGWTLPEAVPVALLSVSLAAAFGTALAWPSGVVRYRAAMVISGASLLTAPVGLLASGILPLSLLSLLFALSLSIVALRLLILAQARPEETRAVRAATPPREDGGNDQRVLCKVRPETGRLRWTRPCFLAMTGSGLFTGFFSGLLGVGGGFIIVPALRAFSDLSFHAAVGTSLMAVAITSLYTVSVALATGKALPWAVALPFMAGTLAGMLVGRRLAPRITGPRLQSGFSLLMLAIAVAMIVQALFGNAVSLPE